ncbi:MAG: WD40 repeat domain-containing protein [Deltaproteobacteria bacterium]|nr:WD40 repeat domain-containing protein [Deltaproteobacteria bacterium]
MNLRTIVVVSWVLAATASWAACRRPEPTAAAPPAPVDSAEGVPPTRTPDGEADRGAAVPASQETAGPDDGGATGRTDVAEPEAEVAVAPATCVWPPANAPEATESVHILAERLFGADDVGEMVEGWAPRFRVFAFDSSWQGILDGRPAAGLLVVGGTGFPTVWSVPGPEPVLYGQIPHGEVVDGRLLADGTTLRVFYASSTKGADLPLAAPLVDLGRQPGTEAPGPSAPAVFGRDVFADGRHEAYGGWDGVVRLDGRTFAAHCGPTTALAFSDDGCLLASAGADSVIRLWRASDGELVAAIATPIPAASVRVSRDGSRIAVADASGATLWTLGRPEMSEPAGPQSSAAPASSAGPSGRRAECSEGTARAVVDGNTTTLTSGRRTRRLDGYPQGPDEEHGGNEGCTGDVTIASFSPDCSRLAASGSCRGTTGVTHVVSPWCRREFVQLWSVETGKLERKLESPWTWLDDEREALALTFTPDGEWIAALSRGRQSDCSWVEGSLQFTIWNVLSGARILDEDVTSFAGEYVEPEEGGDESDEDVACTLAFAEDGAVAVTLTAADGAMDSFHIR